MLAFIHVNFDASKGAAKVPRNSLLLASCALAALLVGGCGDEAVSPKSTTAAAKSQSTQAASGATEDPIQASGIVGSWRLNEQIDVYRADGKTESYLARAEGPDGKAVWDYEVKPEGDLWQFTKSREGLKFSGYFVVEGDELRFFTDAAAARSGAKPATVYHRVANK